MRIPDDSVNFFNISDILPLQQRNSNDLFQYVFQRSSVAELASCVEFLGYHTPVQGGAFFELTHVLASWILWIGSAGAHDSEVAGSPGLDIVHWLT